MWGVLVVPPVVKLAATELDSAFMTQALSESTRSSLTAKRMDSAVSQSLQSPVFKTEMDKMWD